MHWYVLFASWCTYLVPVICTYTYNTEYVLTSTYLYVFCTYIHTWTRTEKFIQEQKIFGSVDNRGSKSWDRCSQSHWLCLWICSCCAHLSLRYASKWSLYYTLINIMAHYRPSNNKEIWCTNDVKICNNDVIMKQGGLKTPCFIITSLLHIITLILHYYFIIITMSIMGQMMHNML